MPANLAMQQLAQIFANLAARAQAAAVDLTAVNARGVISAMAGVTRAFSGVIGFARHLGEEFRLAGVDIKTRFVAAFPRLTAAMVAASRSVGAFALSLVPTRGALAVFGRWLGGMAARGAGAASRAGGALGGVLASGAGTAGRAALGGARVLGMAAVGGVVGGMVAGKAVKGAVAVGGAVGGAAKGVLDGALGAIAGVAGAFTSIIGIASKFVEALNPAIMDQLNLAFSDLFAVVGRLFVPVMAAVIPIVRTFADAMVPVVQGLMPVFGILAEALMNLAGPIIGIFSGVLLTLTPIFEQFAKGLTQIAATIGQSLGPIIDAILPVLMVLLQLFIDLLPAVNDMLKAFAMIFTSGLQLAIPYLVWALQGLAEAIVYVVSWFGKTMKEGAVIMSDFAKTLMPAEGPTKTLKIPEITPDSSRGAASKGAQFMGFAELGKGLMAASFGSGANTPEMKTAENTGKIVAGIDKLVAGQNPPPAGGLPINQPGAGKR